MANRNIAISMSAAALLVVIACSIVHGSIDDLGDQRTFGGGTDGAPFNPSVYDRNSPTAVIEDDGSAQSPYNVTGGSPTDTKGILLTNQTGTDSPSSGATFAAGLFDTNKTYYVQFDYKAITAASNPGFILGRAEGSRSINIHMTGSSGSVQVNQGSGFGDVAGMSLVAGNWYRFTLTINPLSAADDTFDLRVQSLDDGSIDKTATGLGFQNDTASSFPDFDFHFNTLASTSTGQFAVDNVRFTDMAGELNFDAPPRPKGTLFVFE